MLPGHPGGGGGGGGNYHCNGNGGGVGVFASRRRKMWSKDTDLVLRDLVLRSVEIDWTKIASAIEWDYGAVTASECSERYV